MQAVITNDSITVFWDRPDNLPEDFYYLIFLDGKEAGETKKTHYTIDGLSAETEYKIEVKLCEITESADVGGGGCIFAEAVTIKTARPKARLDVTKAPYYAVGDGQTMNTKMLQKAIDDCGAAEAVYLPAGVFMTGALRLHSDMELYLDEGAVLQGTDNIEDYLPKIKSRFEGTEMECYSSLINLGELDHESGCNCRNVVIRGKGTIASGGVTLAKRVIVFERERLKDYLASLGDKINECESKDTIPGRMRPRLINISNAENVVLSGLTLKNGASWNVHMIYSDNIVTNDCTFYSEGVWNGDGWDPDSSTNCTIFNCRFFTEDDCVAIKSGKNPEGNIINKPCKHIRVFDCVSSFGHGIIIGSEISGGIEDIRIWDCDVKASLCGIEIKGTKKRGGYVRDIHISNCKTSKIMLHSVGYNDDGIPAKTPPVFENCLYENIEIGGEILETDRTWSHDTAITVHGFDEPGYEARNITFRNITIIGREGNKEQQFSLKNCENVTFEGVRCL
ncbi:MAG: glycosyl hydrolase family 28 protein [Bacillus sp. (in: Bacteria)]|nr:glycosyl hydrolase family 28 protein [Bacillus sp. (in: firmicutes)]MCM1426415.1 glycosyl hydrolase family 28 protein [Eubacterium sp.]